MPKSLADGRIKVSLLAVRPANPNAVTVQEAAAGIDASCRILSSDYVAGPTASDTVAEKELCKTGNASALGASNYEVSFSPFRYFGANQVADPVEDAVFQATDEKGTTLYVLERETSKLATEPFAADDEYSLYEVVTDNPQRIDLTGYIKRKISTQVQEAWLGKKLVGAAPGAPTATAGTPSAAATGTALTLAGTNFVGVTKVTVGGIPATFAVWSPTSLTLVVPAGTAGATPIVVTAAGGASAAYSYTRG